VLLLVRPEARRLKATMRTTMSGGTRRTNGLQTTSHCGVVDTLAARGDKQRRKDWQRITKQHAALMRAADQSDPSMPTSLTTPQPALLEEAEDVTTVIVEPQRDTSSSDLRRQRRHVCEYERALKRGPPAPAVHGQWRTWLHRPVLQAILQWIETHAPDGITEWYDEVRLVARNARTASDDPRWEWEYSFGIPYNVESYEAYSGRDTWAAASLDDYECDHYVPVSSNEYGQYKDGT